MNPKIISNSNVENTLAERAQYQHETITPCVNCQGSSFTKLYDSYDFDTGKKRFTLESCTNCKLTRTYPFLKESELSAYYDTAYYGSAKQKFNPLVESWTIWSNNHLAKRILKKEHSPHNQQNDRPRVLDIGCGRANLLKALRRNGCECSGVERTNFPDAPEFDDIAIYKEDFLNIEFKQNSFDYIIIWHVLEHLIDPASTLKKIKNILKPGGYLIIAVPNFGSLQSKFFSKHWFHLDLPRHTFHFTHQSLHNLLERTGFITKSVKTGGVDQSLFGFIQSAINTTGASKPNLLYKILKTRKENPGYFTIFMQLTLAITLFPIAILEYLVSQLLNSGACLIVEAEKHQTD